MKVKTIISAAMAVAISFLSAGAQVRITGTGVIEVAAERDAGYATVYVVQHGTDATVEYTAKGGAAVSVERFSNLGAAYAEPMPGVVRDGNVYSFSPGRSDMGYVITDGSDVRYFWVVNYDNCRYNLTRAWVDEGRSDCGRVVIESDVTLDGGGAPVYYGITGRRFSFSRDVIFTYYTLVYDSESESYRQEKKQDRFASVIGGFGVEAPLCDTRFTISPDRFTREWYPSVSDVETGSYTAVAVDAHTTATQIVETHDNEQKTEGAEGALGGSGPCDITFKAVVSDAVVFRRWEISPYAEFEDVELAYDQLEFTHTFADAGTRYVRFTADNTEGSCPFVGETYQVNIGESSLLCPNAFSPGASEGVNDEWKVSYRSIVSFDCQIFNRWGQRLATLTDPSQGWDGKHGGKVVPSGVYFYVIKARGADGKDYKLAGDINVINSRRGSGTQQPVE